MTTRETKLQSLQYKILHRILPCRKYLHTIRVVDLDRCQYCDNQDSTSHFLYECVVSKRLWDLIRDWLSRVQGPNISGLTTGEIILGVGPSVTDSGLMDYITAYKKFLYIARNFFTFSSTSRKGPALLEYPYLQCNVNVLLPRKEFVIVKDHWIMYDHCSRNSHIL